MEDQAPPWLAKASRDQLKVELADGSSVPINDAQWQEIQNFQQGKPLEPNYMFCIGQGEMVIFLTRTGDQLPLSYTGPPIPPPDTAAAIPPSDPPPPPPPPPCMASPNPALFGAHPGTVGLEYLEGTKSLTAASAQEIKSIIAQLGGSSLETPSVVDAALGATACAALRKYLDERAALVPQQHELRLTVSDGELCGLIGVENFESLCRVFGSPVDKIMMRRVTASCGEPCPEQRCVFFHTDWSKRTMQVALSGDHEYDGGRLIFATSRGFVQPARPAGCATIHNGGLTHGVSVLSAGTRYGLFLCATPDAACNGVSDLQYLAQATAQQFPFFERAVAFLDAHTDADLKKCVDEYIAFATSGGVGGRPSFEAELAWRTHLLHPLMYAKTFPLLDHRPESAESYDHADTGGADGEGRTPHVSLAGLDIDLIRAMRRQGSFMQGVLSYRDKLSPEAVGAAVGDYYHFLTLFRHDARNRPPPTSLIDLVWHVHMLHPLRYRVESARLAGCFLDHDDDLETPTAAAG